MHCRLLHGPEIRPKIGLFQLVSAILVNCHATVVYFDKDDDVLL